LGVIFLAKKLERAENQDAPFNVNIQSGDAPNSGTDLGLGYLIRPAFVQLA